MPDADSSPPPDDRRPAIHSHTLPRLGIRHFLLWMMATGVLLAINSNRSFVSGFYATINGIQIVVVLEIARQWFLRRKVSLQPGHWLCFTTTLYLSWSILFHVVNHFLPMTSVRSVSTWVSSCGFVLLAALLFFASKCSHSSRIWNWCFVLYGLMFLGMSFRTRWLENYDFSGVTYYELYQIAWELDRLCFPWLILAAAISDYRHARPRDWGNYAGTSGLILAEVIRLSVRIMSA